MHLPSLVGASAYVRGNDGWVVGKERQPVKPSTHLETQVVSKIIVACLLKVDCLRIVIVVPEKEPASAEVFSLVLILILVLVFRMSRHGAEV